MFCLFTPHRRGPVARTGRAVAPARAATIAILLTALPAASLAAQMTHPDLARIDSLIAAGRTDDARASLTRWQTRNTEAPADARAHALFLTGRLSLRWTDAEAAYASVALSYPTSPHAPAALLRLGQGLLTAASTGASGAAIRAAGYLERLTHDYPNAPERAVAMLWLARAYLAAQRVNPACEAATAATRMQADPETAALIRATHSRACPQATPSATPADLFAVQIGAFSSRAGAAELAARLSARGFEARIVTLEGGSLFRVRAGRFDNARDADVLARRIRAAGFETIIVDDVRQERDAR